MISSNLLASLTMRAIRNLSIKTARKNSLLLNLNIERGSRVVTITRSSLTLVFTPVSFQVDTYLVCITQPRRRVGTGVVRLSGGAVHATPASGTLTVSCEGVQ